MLMRYAEDKSLVYFRRPPLPQSFDLLLCCAKDEMGEADDIRDELHKLAHTMGVKVHRKGIQANTQPGQGNLQSARSRRKYEQVVMKKMEELHEESMTADLGHKTAVAFVLSKAAGA